MHHKLKLIEIPCTKNKLCFTTVQILMCHTKYATLEPVSKVVLPSLLCPLAEWEHKQNSGRDSVLNTIPVFLIPHRRSNRIQDHDPSLNWHKYSKQGSLQKKKREKRSRKRKRLQKGHECHYSTISTQNWNRPKRMQVQTPLNMNLTNAMTKAVLATAHENRVARKNSQWQSSLLRCTVDKQRQHNVWNRFRQIYKI